MNHRSYGETRNCKGCRFWSEMIAQARGGPVEAMCLSQTGPQRSRYTIGIMTCDAWASGHLGAIDDPGSSQDRYAQEAKAEEGRA